MASLVFILISVFLLLACLAVYFFYKSFKKKKLLESLQLKLFLVRLPKKNINDSKDIKQEIGLFEQFISAFSSAKKPIVFEIAVPYVGEEIHFYVSLPEKLGNVLSRQIQSLWSDAQVDPVEDYNIFNYSGAFSYADVLQKEKYALPVRTYQELNSDTFSSILGGLTKINQIGEGGAVQFVVYPASKKEKKGIVGALKNLKKGGKLKDDIQNLSFSFDYIKEAALHGVEKSNSENEKKIVDESAIKALEMKISKPLFFVNVRIVTSAPDKYQSDALLQGISAGFSQFGSPEKNEFLISTPKNTKNVIENFSFRIFKKDHAMVLNSEELASIFHFPTSLTEIPRIKQLTFKEVPPPSNLPSNGIILGESRYRGERRVVRMTKEDRRRHLYVIGQTGTGKSVLLNNLSGQDIQNNEGICLIDPNGDLFEDVLSRIPKERIKDTIVFDPGDLSNPFGLNMLEYDPSYPEQKTFIVNELMTIFDTLYDLKTTGGPMFEQYTRNALLLLMDDPSLGHTILEIPKVLADSDFRKRLLSNCKNMIAKDFWEKEAEKAGGDAALANIVPYITSKFNTFIANDYVRPIIAQSKSTLNFRQIMDEGKILLVKLSRGKIGELNSSLLGMIIIGKLTIAAFSRADVLNEQQRRDFYLYIDEFQNFTTPSITTILSEARKYRLCLTVAHQFISQLKDPIKNAIFGNVGSMVAFRIGADDGEYLSKQFAPVFDQNNLINIDNLNAHVKLIINNQVAPPFNIFVQFPPRGSSEYVEMARNYSRATYGRPRDVVESEIYSRLKNI